VRSLCSLFFKCKYKERDTLCVVAFDIVACMDSIEYLLLYYSHTIPPLDALLNYGTNTTLKKGIPSPPSGLVFNIAR
jgi:hypothetical protein